jgi:hypothetical protein
VPNRTDLKQMVGEEATIVAAGETLSAADNDYLERRIEAKLAFLLEEGLIPFDIQGTIPQAYMLPLARAIAGEMAPGFGMDVATAKTLELEGMRALRRLKAKPYFGTPTKATYY